MKNTATLKIDSFRGRNVVLINGKPVTENSAFMNYYNQSILACASKLLDTFESEFNDEYILEVYGSLFEQEYIKLLCKENDCCAECICRYPFFNLSTRERLNLIAAETPIKEAIGLNIVTDLSGFSPEGFDCISFSANAGNKVIVSKDIDFIADNITPDVPVAFLVDGNSTKINATYVIGCDEGSYKELVDSYIASCYINPAIYKASPTNKEAYLVDAEYYMDGNSAVSVELGSKYTLPVKSMGKKLSADELTVVSSNGAIRVNGLELTATAMGNAEVSVYYDTPFPVATLQVNVFVHSYISSIKILVDGEEAPEIHEGSTYDISVLTIPENAEDLSSVVLSSSDNGIAEIKDNKLVVKQDGEFTLTATSTNCTETKELVSVAALKKIKISGAPSVAYIGDVIPLTVKLVPENNFNDEVKWTTSDKNVAVVGRGTDGQISVKTVGVGKVCLKCTSVEDEKVSAKVDIKVKSTFEKDDNKQTFFVATIFFGIVAFVLSTISGFLGIATLPVCFGMAYLSFTREPKQKIKSVLAFIIIAVVVLNSSVKNIDFSFLKGNNTSSATNVAQTENEETTAKALTADTMPAETFIEYANRYASEEQASHTDSPTFTYSTVQVYGVYFAQNKNDDTDIYKNDIHILIYYTQYYKGEYHSTIYLPLIYRNVAFDENGGINTRYEDGSKTGLFYTSAENYLDDVEAQYDLTKLT